MDYCYLQVIASDGDEGENGRVIYSLKDPADRINFQINETTGIITSTRIFDYENQTTYTITVTAQGNFGKMTIMLVHTKHYTLLNKPSRLC